jgi:hypothetical protein
MSDIPYSSPPSLFSGDRYVLLGPGWDTIVQTCVQVDDPLPATILGIIFYVVPGDTGD